MTASVAEPVSIHEAMVHCRIDTANQEPAPGAMTAALAATPAAGNVDNGVHRWLATFVTADGETQAGTVSAPVTVTDKTVNGQVELTAIPVGGALVTARKIYRTAAGGSVYLLAATIADNTTTTYTDNIADASLGVGAPSTNTTTDPLLALFIASARYAAEQELRRKLITQTVDVYFDRFPYYENSEYRDVTTRYALRLMPLQSVTSIVYIDIDGVEQTLAADQYTVDAVSAPARVAPAYGVSWPATREQANAVRVRIVAGYGDPADVPACIKNWMLIRIKTLWENRDQIVVGVSGMVELPPNFIDRLLDPERVYGRA